MPHVLTVIPARMAASRLPGKPLADIAGRPMIVRVWERAVAADVGPVIVATDTEEIAAAVRAAGGMAALTRPDHPSGSDRIWEAVDLAVSGRDPSLAGAVVGGEAPEIILNLQGDLPTISADDVRATLAPLADPAVDIATLATEIRDDTERSNPNVVKVVGTPLGDGRTLQALYFTRATAPFGDGPLFHHIGIYAYRRAALARFVALPPAPLEKRERLEQLRALENGLRIDVALVATVPLGVDTPEDLARARAAFSS